MAKTASLTPTAENTYRITCSEGGTGVEADFGKALRISQQLEERGDIEGACNMRYEAFRSLMELIPDSTGIELDWDDPDSRDAMLVVSYSAIDHFLLGDFEMSAAMLEMLLELDPEDHLEASKLLAYDYVALEEWELFDEVINDVGDKHPDKDLLVLWSEFRQSGTLPTGELRHFQRSFKPYYDEFTAAEHPVDEHYLADIRGENPSKKALARELWIQTEHLWKLVPGFIEALGLSGART
jgi:tetratricopeptide (TPR) repeat protein